MFQVFSAFHVRNEEKLLKNKVAKQHSPPYWQQCSIQPAVTIGEDLHDKPEQLQSDTRRQQEAF